MTEIIPDMCSCCEEIWNRENLKNIPLGKHELHLCPDCYREYIISNNKVLDKIEEEINSPNRGTCDYFIVDRIEELINKYKAEIEPQEGSNEK